jgi:hypothetical protein
MQQSWWMPVAQALQRHSGGWKASPPKDEACGSEPGQCEMIQAPSLVPAPSADASEAAGAR